MLLEVDILVYQERYLDLFPTDIWLTDIRRPDISPTGHFVNRTFPRKDNLPTDIQPKVCYGHFADRNFADTHKINSNNNKYLFDTYVLMEQ